MPKASTPTPNTGGGFSRSATYSLTEADWHIRQREAAAASLSLSHNSANDDEEQAELAFRLTGSQRKTAESLRLNIETMIREGGLENIGFLTLTVGDEIEGEPFRQVWDTKEASRRINLLARRFLPSICRRSVLVTERHKSGAIHFHLVADFGRDIRGDFQFPTKDERASGKHAYNANGALLRLWALLRAELPKFGFGRANLEPLKDGAAAARYVAKYVKKNLFNRLPEDRRAKLVRYHGWQKMHVKPNEWSWATEGAAKWRASARRLSEAVAVRGRREVAEAFGPRWAFRLTSLMGVATVVEPEAWNSALRDRMAHFVAQKARPAWLEIWRARERDIFGAETESINRLLRAA